MLCGTFLCAFEGVSVCCVWDSLVWVWGIECVLCVVQFFVGLGDCVCAVCGTVLCVFWGVCVCCVWDSFFRFGGVWVFCVWDY